jgi:2-polyprenyl-3-methyl-5-hydroxy-6-metoxy-1,4-benzoquinol methylase
MKRTLVVIFSLTLFFGTCYSQVTKGEQEEKHAQDMNKHEHMSGDTNKSNIHMNKAPFDNLAKAFEDDGREDWQKPDVVIRLLGDLVGKTVGDIGSGTGYFSFRLADQGANVVAIDVDERFQAFIEEKKAENNVSNLTTRLVGYDNPELADDEFDALIIVNTYHHFNNKLEYMGHCKQGLKKDGMLMIVDYKKEATSHGPPVDHRIAAELVKQDLKESGFRKIKVDSNTLSEQYIITAIK